MIQRCRGSPLLCCSRNFLISHLDYYITSYSGSNTLIIAKNSAIFFLRLFLFSEIAVGSRFMKKTITGPYLEVVLFGGFRTTSRVITKPDSLNMPGANYMGGKRSE